MDSRADLVVDGHLDLAFDAIQLKRDLTQPARTIRSHDTRAIQESYGSCTVSLPELRRGNVGVVLGTVMTRVDPNDRWTRTGMYRQSQCYGVGMGHAAYYAALERLGHIRLLKTLADLDEHLDRWGNAGAGAPGVPIGLVLTMESADAILDPDNVLEWHQRGLRMVSIAHYGVNTYTHGTGTEGGLLEPAGPLLDALGHAGIIVDLTHLTDQAFWEVLERYDGPVAASHHNCRALVPGQRQLTDEMIRAIAGRGGVIGASFDAWMLDPGWRRDDPAWSQRSSATIATVVDHIQHICEVTGSVDHSGIGSDLDGGFGVEQSPRDMDSIADVQRVANLLRERGFPPADVTKVMNGNWMRLLRSVMP